MGKITTAEGGRFAGEPDSGHRSARLHILQCLEDVGVQTVSRVLLAE
jgi:hypothetical protein